MSFPEWMRKIGKVYKEQGSSIFVEIPLSSFERVMKLIRSHGIAVVNAISGYDSGKNIEILYHFIHTGVVLTVKVKISRKSSTIPSVKDMFPSADIFERENHEMLGINFKGNDNLKPILLAEDSPRTPLRKDSEERGK